MGRFKCLPVVVLMKKRHLGEGERVQKKVDSECLRLMAGYTPLDTSQLVRSATDHTIIGSGRIVQRTPYAKRHYYKPAHFQGAPKRGNLWFLRMKKDHKENILKVAKKASGGK